VFSKAALAFLDQLAANNNRTWFEANKPSYEALGLRRRRALDGVSLRSCGRAVLTDAACPT
jgi:hypothetical protein